MRGWAIWLGHVCGPCECGPCVGGQFGWVMLVGHVIVDHAWVGHVGGPCMSRGCVRVGCKVLMGAP